MAKSNEEKDMTSTKKKYHRYNLSLSDHQNDALLKLYGTYKTAGGQLSITPFITSTVLTTSHTDLALQEKNHELMRKSVYELNKIGVNLNQISMKLKAKTIQGDLLLQCSNCLSELKSSMLLLHKRLQNI